MLWRLQALLIAVFSAVTGHAAPFDEEGENIPIQYTVEDEIDDFSFLRPYYDELIEIVIVFSVIAVLRNIVPRYHRRGITVLVLFLFFVVFLLRRI